MKFTLITIRPPQGHHYTFAEIEKTLYFGLQSLGHDCIIVDAQYLHCEAVDFSRQYIILGCNSNAIQEKPFPLPPHSIIYNFEQIYPQSPWLRAGYIDYLCQYPVWDYSLANIEQLRQLGIHHVAHVPVGYVPEMTCISPAVERDIDVLFYGSLNERRQLILEALEEKGVTVKVLFEVYGAERDAYIARSKIVLNLHFYEAKVFEIVRISYLLSNRVFVISERGCCPEEEAYFAEGLVFADYDHLVKTCIDYLQQPEQRDCIAQKGFELMQACGAPDYLAQGIEAIERIQPAHNPGGIFIKDFYRKHLAKSAFYQGEYEQAVTLYEETLTVDPEDVESYWALGLVWHCLGDVLAAEMVWSIPLNSEDMDQLQNLLNFLHREREFLAQNPQVVLEPVRHKILTEIEAILEELNP